ncbi:MAG: glycoside hydrolase [Kiritimatiellae bacterium]|nr:glycoside hydrolase [Kiritimatiellia bacterium]
MTTQPRGSSNRQWGLRTGLALLGIGTAAIGAPLDLGLKVLDLSADDTRQTVVDREAGQYLGHVSTVLLEDGRTIFAVYPKGHGKGAIVLKRSTDGGRSWSERLPVPASWATSLETPTIHRVVDAAGRRRLILWSGRYPARLARSDDDGVTWSELEPVGDWGGTVVMGSVVALRDAGHYLAMFHDAGAYFTAGGRATQTFTLYQTISTNGGLSWSVPTSIWSGAEVHLCEPGAIRSPDGGRLAVLLRENRRVRGSHIMFSDDEGVRWSEPVEMPRSRTGDRHTLRYAPDGRIVCVFRAATPEGMRGRPFGVNEDVDKAGQGSPFEGDCVAWVGTWEDLVRGAPGQYYVRLLDNRRGWDTTYPGVEVLPDGTVVVTTYGTWDSGQPPYIRSMRFRLDELDALARRTSARVPDSERRAVAALSSMPSDAGPDSAASGIARWACAAPDGGHARVPAAVCASANRQPAVRRHCQ